MQTMHTKGVTMCTFTPVTENRILKNDCFFIMYHIPYVDIFPTYFRAN